MWRPWKQVSLPGGLKLGQVDHGGLQHVEQLVEPSLLMKLSIWRSLTSITGASAQAPRHSLGCTVKVPSAVVP
jgi:hypothetical protein